MAKLNYINRKSEGVKLGSIIAKDLRKRIKSPISTNEPQKDISGLELNVQGKRLSDEGLVLAAEGLEDALAISSTRLQILNLADNDLTAASLGRLAPSLLKCWHDLEELDLSRNNISVRTDDDVQFWEIFLDSLSRCRVLRRLNLTGNNFSGSKSFEVFTRTFLKQFCLNEERWERMVEVGCNVMNISEAAEKGLNDTVKQLALEDEEDLSSDLTTISSKSVVNPKRAYGIPSIQTISFTKSAMNDAGALFLSYVVPRHRWIQNELITSARCHHARTDMHDSLPTGILYAQNDGLSAAGVKMLQLADITIYDPFSQQPGSQEVEIAGEIERLRKPTGANSHHRKFSSDNVSVEQVKKPNTIRVTGPEELETLRRKVQRTIIETEGVNTVELWRVALRLLNQTRLLLTRDAPKRPEECPPLEIDVERRDFDDEGTLLKHSTWSKTLYSSPNEWPELGASAILSSCKSATPNVSPHPRKNRQSDSHGTSPASSAHTASTTATKPLHGPEGESSPNETLLCGLTKDMWRRILDDVARSVVRKKSEIVGLTKITQSSGFCHAPSHPILSAKQQNNVLSWGQDRRTLTIELDLLGKPQSVQIWRVLEGLGCLAYDEE